MKWREHIVSDPGVLREFSDLKAEDVSACLDYARELAEFAAVAA